jgi:hypothetical protein
MMSIKQRLLTMALLTLTLTIGVSSASATDGTVAVTATTVASVSLVFVTDAGGITLGGSTTGTATIAFGTVQAYGGTIPAGVTRTVNGTTDWSLSTPFDVVVQVANDNTSDNYTLTAGLQSADGVNTWALGAVDLGALPVELTAVGAYGSTPYTFTLTIPFSENAGLISNTMNFVATAN